MNEHYKPASQRPTTQAAEGLPRWRWTTAELIRLTELGAFTTEDRLELIGGEIVPMSPVGRRHEVLASLIEDALRQLAPKNIRVRTERQLNLSDDTYAKPDVFVHRGELLPPDVRGETVLLVIEVADSSLDFDLGQKADRYAAHGVREYWVVDVATHATTVHRSPMAAGYAEKCVVPRGDRLVASLVPELDLRLVDLDRE